MADITISDLELAPALADDMVLAVENTTDTYAATLAMLRRLINKTFVGVNNADFNDLTDDGFYQCTGTPTNSPEAGAINWTLQVSAESGVVVQRAFSLDDGFENFYIRRFNGVMWTAWKNMTNVVGTPFSLGDSRYFEVAPYNTSWLASNGQYNSSFVYQSMWGQLQVELSNINVGEVGTYNGYSYTKRGLPVVLSTDTITDYDFVVNQDDQTFRLPLKTKLASGSAVVGNGSVVGLTGYVEGGSSKYEGALGRKDDDSRLIDLINNSSGGTELKSAKIGAIGTIQTTWGVMGVGISEAPEKSGIETSSNGLKLYYYVGDTVQDASLINAGAVLGQLSDKISRTATSDKELVVGWGMPDYSAGITINTTSYTAPTNGWLEVNVSQTNAVAVLKFENVEIYYGGGSATSHNNCGFLPVAKNTTLTGSNPGGILKFFPCIGA